MAATIEELLGRTLCGRYRIDAVLGAGGMGVVYQGTQLDAQPPRQIAIKTLLPESNTSLKVRERFQREAVLARRLRHDGVAEVLDFGVEGDVLFLIMELVGGVDLGLFIRQEAPLPSRVALLIARRIVDVLVEAHAIGLVHRDIKPANIRILRGPAQDAVAIKILDFGIAKDLTAAQDQLTTTGAMMGTPLYLAPEQAVDAKRSVDCRADQYATGVVLYEMLAGRPPFLGSTVASVLFAHVMKPPPSLPREVPAPLRRVVQRMLKKDPADRYAEPRVLARALVECEAACATAPAAPRPSEEDVFEAAGGDSGPLQARRRVPLLLLLGAVCILAAGIFVLRGAMRSGGQPMPAAVAPSDPTATSVPKSAVTTQPGQPAGGSPHSDSLSVSAQSTAPQASAGELPPSRAESSVKPVTRPTTTGRTTTPKMSNSPPIEFHVPVAR